MPQTKTSPRPLMAKKTEGKEDNNDEEEDLQQQPVQKKRKNPPLKDDTNTKGVKETSTSTSTSNSKKKAPAKKSSSSASRVKGKKSTTTKAKGEQSEGDHGDHGDDDDSVASTSSSSGSEEKTSPTKKIMVKKRKIKKKKIATKKNEDSNTDDSDEEPISKMASKKASPPKAVTKKRKAKDDEEDGGNESEKSSSSSSSPSKKTTAKKKATTTTTSPSKKKKAKSAKAPVQSITERDELPKLWSEEQAKENGSCTFRIASWNVAGLRAVIRKDPDALAKLVKQHNIDVLCLQETKLQEIHLDDPKLKIRGHILEEEGYDSYYSCSTAKKGYAGTAVFVRRRGPVKGKQKTLDSFFGPSSKSTKGGSSKAAAKSTSPVDPKQLMPEQVTYELGSEKHDKEGRMICLDFPGFTMANLYVPNSGQKLDRLDYRTEEWDKDLVAFAKGKQKERGLPVMWLGDLNVAHKNLEAYNFGAKHLDKQAGLTPQERASFTEQLESGPFFDAFRHLHPSAKGHYSYWSQRAGNRGPNKGLRLDYFVCDPSFFQEDSKVIARDSYMIPDQLGSDHCPVVLELEIKP